MGVNGEGACPAGNIQDTFLPIPQANNCWDTEKGGSRLSYK